MKENFSITLYGENQQITPTILKKRARIFYKGKNRNRTFISEEVAEQIIQTLPYTPVVGIYNEENEDFTDHGEKRSDAIPYGVIPYDNNFSWETNEDPDGITRTYACCDVYIWNQRNPEANLIPNKALSMELHRDSMKGKWEIIDGEMYYKLSQAYFLGICALGNGVKPCYEGASFYNLECDKIEDLQKVADNILIYNKKEEQKSMNSVTYNLSFSEINDKLFNALNPEYNAENNYVANYFIAAVYSDCVVAYNCEDGNLYRFNYSMDESNNVVLENSVLVTFVPLTSEEESIINSAKTSEQQTISELITELSDKITVAAEANMKAEEELSQALNSLNDANSEKENLNSDLCTVRNDLESHKAQIEELNQKISSLEGANAELTNYKLNVENREKEALINQFSSLIPQDTLSSFQESLTNYTYSDLEKELAVYAVRNNQVFRKNDTAVVLPKEEDNEVLNMLRATKNKK